jgi:hypothetical protein
VHVDRLGHVMQSRLLRLKVSVQTLVMRPETQVRLLSRCHARLKASE